MRRLACALAFFVLPSIAWAACSNTLSIKDSAGNPQQECVGTDGGSNLFPTLMLVDGTVGANRLAIDASGRITVLQGASPWAVTANAGTNLNTSALALESGGNLATLAGAVASSRMNVNLSSLSAGLHVSTTLDQISGSAIGTAASGVQKVGIVGNAGAAFDAAGQNVASPANEILVGGQFNTTPSTLASGNMSPLQINNKGLLLVDLAANDFGTLAVSGTITANAGTNLNTSALALDATVASLVVAQASTTSGQKGVVMMGAVTTASPSYTTAQTNPISLTTSGEVRESLTSAASGLHLSSNVDQWNGNAVAASVGNASSGSPRVTLATADGANTPTVKAASASPALTDTSLVVAQSPNPAPVCTGIINLNQITTTDLHTFTNFGYICSILLISATAQNITLDEGTGSTCQTGTAYLIGGSGITLSLVANGGFSMVSDRPWLKMVNSADHLCLYQSGPGNISGIITYADHS